MQETASPKTETPLPVAPEEKVIAEPEEESEEKATTEPEEKPESEPGEGTQDEPEEPAPPSFDYEVLKDDPDLKALIEEKESKAHRQGQIRETGRRKETQALVTQVMQGVGSLNKTLTDAAKAGNLADNFQDIIRENAPVLGAYGQLLQDHVVTQMREQNRANAIADTLFEISAQVDDQDLAQPYYERLLQPSGRANPEGQPIYLPADEFSIDGGKEVLTDFIKDLVKAVDKKGFERGVRSRDGTDTERDKVKGREGKGPGEVKDSGTGNKPYAELTRDQCKKLAEEGRVDEYIEKHG